MDQKRWDCMCIKPDVTDARYSFRFSGFLRNICSHRYNKGNEQEEEEDVRGSMLPRVLSSKSITYAIVSVSQELS